MFIKLRSRSSLRPISLIIASMLAVSICATFGGHPKLVVRPHGTNHLDISISPTVEGGIYIIFARTNSADGFWIEFTALEGTSNGVATVRYDLAETQKYLGLKGLTAKQLGNWTLIARAYLDSDGDGLSDSSEDLATRTDPTLSDTGNAGTSDGYQDFDGDNWSNMEEIENGTDPFGFDQPPATCGMSIYYTTNDSAVLKWGQCGHTAPEYYVIEKAERRFINPSSTGLRRPQQREPDISTAEYKQIAMVVAKPELHDYRYVVTNILQIPPYPAFRIRSHFRRSVHAVPIKNDAASIRQTIQKPQLRPIANGYALTVERPHPNAHYLVLCRNKNAYWQASGYFKGGTNQAPIHMKADASGSIIGSAQRQLAMSSLRLPALAPGAEFTIGTGEDSDGDGLPDLFEVLVTETNPEQFDTGKTGVADGDKDLDNDKRSNLQEFRERTNPLKVDRRPASLEPALPRGVMPNL